MPSRRLLIVLPLLAMALAAGCKPRGTAEAPKNDTGASSSGNQFPIENFASLHHRIPENRDCGAKRYCSQGKRCTISRSRN